MANLKDFHLLLLLLPGSTINTSPIDYRVIRYMKLQRFNGKSWDFADDQGACNFGSALPSGKVRGKKQSGNARHFSINEVPFVPGRG